MWAPRLPTPGQPSNVATTNGASHNNNNNVNSNNNNQQHSEYLKISDTSAEHIPISPSSPLGLMVPRSRFTSTPLSTRLRKSPSSSKASSPTCETPGKRNGFGGYSSVKEAAAEVLFRVPESLPLHQVKRPGSAGNGFPRIVQSGWRCAGSVSKTYDCIERGKTSPVLSLAEQAKAVSSPDPLHRPENARASFIAAISAAQNYR